MCRSRLGSEKLQRPSFYQQMAVEGSEAQEKAKLMLEAELTPKPLRGYERVNPNGKRPHRRPPRFSHLEPEVRAEAERILSGLMFKYRDRLDQPGQWRYLGCLVAVATRLALLKGKSLHHYNQGRYAFRRHLMIQLGLVDKPVRRPADAC